MNDCVDALTETVQHRMSECLGRRLQRSDAHDAIAGDISTDDAAIVFGPGRREATRLRPADDEFARSGSTNADVAEAYVELGIVPDEPCLKERAAPALQQADGSGIGSGTRTPFALVLDVALVDSHS
jgi:hypothetical protein